MGVANLFLRMFLRKLKNRSGSTSIQILSKERGKYKVIKTIGSSNNEQGIQKLVFLGRQEIERLNAQSKLFISENDSIVEQVFEALGNASIRTVGPEIIFGKIYDSIGFNKIKENLFRHLVIARLAFPLSKLKTIEYLYRFQGVMPVSYTHLDVYKRQRRYCLQKYHSRLHSLLNQLTSLKRFEDSDFSRLC